MQKQLVYLLKCQEFYKIGYTTNIEERIKSLQTGNPFFIELLKTYPVVSKSCEKILHEKLKQYQKRGEWFHLSVKEIEFIEKYLEAVNDTISYFDSNSITHNYYEKVPTKRKYVKRRNRTLLKLNKSFLKLKELKGSNPTQQELAKKSNVSLVTVKRYWSKIDKLDYYPKRNQF